MIQLQDVGKVYGKKKATFQALTDISFSIPTGAAVAIVGKSGSGKSTLMHVMSGLDRATAGDIIIDGVNLSSLKQKTVDAFRNEQIGFVFQSFFIQANESCYHNVTLPLEIDGLTGPERAKRVEAALAQVELTEKMHKKAATLSGGQKQRLAIARAIVNKPSILFADEPTGNLDSATGQHIENLLFKLNKESGTTLIIVTHDDELAQKCDMQIYLKDGLIDRIIGQSAPDKQNEGES